MKNKKNQKIYFENNQRYDGKIRASLIKKLSKKYIQTGGKVLDVGARQGALIKLIPNSTGIDLSPKSKIVEKGDLTNLSFKNSIFDVVFATEVLEHLDDEELNKGLVEIKRVLKNNGFFIITVPFKENLDKNKVTCPKCGHSFHRVLHQRSFNKKKLTNILENYGFKIKTIKAFPIGTLSMYPFLQYFSLWKFLNIKPSSYFVVAQKIK